MCQCGSIPLWRQYINNILLSAVSASSVVCTESTCGYVRVQAERNYILLPVFPECGVRGVCAGVPPVREHFRINAKRTSESTLDVSVTWGQLLTIATAVLWAI